MRKLIYALLLITLASTSQAQQGVAVSIRNGLTDPPSCSPATLNIFVNRTAATTADAIKLCTASNTWTALTVGGITQAAADLRYLKLAADNDPLTGALTGVAGTAALPSFSFTGETDTGMFLSAANAIGFSTAGVERWIINASGALNPLVANTYDIGGTATIRDIGVGRNAIVAGIVSSGDGSVSSASFQFGSQAGLGLYKRGASSIGITTGSNIGWFDTTGYHAFGTVVEAFNDIGVTSTDGVILTTNGAAAAGAQDWSPRLRFTGSGWRTDATAESQLVDWIVENQPVQGTASPSSNLVFSSQINAGGFTPRVTFGTTGIPISATGNFDGSTITRTTNTEAVGTAAISQVNVLGSTADVRLQTHGAGRVATRFGVTLANYGELIVAAGNGLLVGTSVVSPLIMGTGGVAGLRLDATNPHPSFPVSEKCVTTQFDTTSTTLATVTGLTVNVTAGKKYRFWAVLHVTADATGGHKYAIAGTATATNVIYQVNSINNATNAFRLNSRQTALGGAGVGEAVGTAYFTTINGFITVNAAGTLLQQFAQNAATGTSSVLVGSCFGVTEVQ
jgi:hypothetical protein